LKLTNYILCVFATAILAVSSCKKNKSNNPIDQLPAATQTGANTFGCLINGQAFTPGGDGFGSPTLSCIYEYAYESGSSTTPSGYVFAIDGIDKRNPCTLTDIGWGFDSVVMMQGFTYNLKIRRAGQGGGQYLHFLNCDGSNVQYNTTDTITGQLILTRFDLSAQIASGTFWFNVLDNNNDTIKITEGRFDVKFTQ
jgi:hypothetical protein